MEKKKIIITFSLLIVFSAIAIGMDNINKKDVVTKNEFEENINELEKIEVEPHGNFDNIYQSTEENIKEPEDTLNNSDGEQKAIIFIENIIFLADKDVTYHDLMNLKSKLNIELKTIDPNVYQVNILEDTFHNTEKGFTVEAKADTINGRIFIEHKDDIYYFRFEE